MFGNHDAHCLQKATNAWGASRRRSGRSSTNSKKINVTLRRRMRIRCGGFWAILLQIAPTTLNTGCQTMPPTPRNATVRRRILFFRNRPNSKTRPWFRENCGDLRRSKHRIRTAPRIPPCHHAIHSAHGRFAPN